MTHIEAAFFIEHQSGVVLVVYKPCNLRLTVLQSLKVGDLKTWPTKTVREVRRHEAGGRFKESNRKIFRDW